MTERDDQQVRKNDVISPGLVLSPNSESIGPIISAARRNGLEIYIGYTTDPVKGDNIPGTKKGDYRMVELRNGGVAYQLRNTNAMLVLRRPD